MLIQDVTYFLTFVGLGSLALIAAAQGLGSQIKRFILLVSAISVWLMLQWLSGFVNQEAGTVLIEASVGFSTFVVLSFLIFIYDYSENHLTKHWLIGLFCLSGIFLAASLAGLTVTEVSFENKTPSITNVSFVYWAQITFIVLVAFEAARKLQARILHQRVKADILLLVALIQALLVSLLVSTVFAPSQEAQLLIPISLLAMCIIIYYAIAKHRLFNIRFFVARLLGYILSALSVVVLYAVLATGTAALFLSGSVDKGQLAVFAVFSIVTAFAFQPSRNFFNRATDRLFYRDAYDSEAFLAEVNKLVVSNVDADMLLKRVSEVITTNLKTDFTLFGLYKTSYVERRIIGVGDTKMDQDAFADLAGFMGTHTDRVLATFDLSPEMADLKRILQSFDVEVVAKLNPFAELDSPGYGLLLLGPKKSGNQYSKQDLAVIRIIAGELSIAVQNALRFEEIERFNVTLQGKVNDATRKLRRNNEKLEAMDETKDEFISMASHQLRTPLTSVKGYVSMVLEGDAGEINDMQRKLLEQAFTSSQRMVFLIADLLNLSRLRTGKFVIEASPSNLADVIEGEVAQLKETALSRSLKLKYTKPKDFPTLMLDETKIRQVIMNFVDNAIYYTPAGGEIEIRLTETEKMVEFTVRDNGIGVPKSEQHHLFNKFYRAKNAQKARPDGTGLGLFMAKKVVVAQGGAIVFSSSEGKGSVFGFSFSKDKLAVEE